MDEIFSKSLPIPKMKKLPETPIEAVKEIDTMMAVHIAAKKTAAARATAKKDVTTIEQGTAPGTIKVPTAQAKPKRKYTRREPVKVLETASELPPPSKFVKQQESVATVEHQELHGIMNELLSADQFQVFMQVSAITELFHIVPAEYRNRLKGILKNILISQ